jgi:hypothetical protein
MITYSNAIAAFAQSGQIDENDFISTQAVDQTEKFAGNTVLRGGQQPRTDKSSIIIS